MACREFVTASYPSIYRFGAQLRQAAARHKKRIAPDADLGRAFAIAFALLNFEQ
jgi:hypothetical protein